MIEGFSTPAGTRERALEHATFFVDALKRNGFRVANVWTRPGYGVRIYLLGGQYVIVAQDGTIDSHDRGRLTFRRDLLYPALRRGFDAAVREHRAWHEANLAEESKRVEEILAEDEDEDVEDAIEVQATSPGEFAKAVQRWRERTGRA